MIGTALCFGKITKILSLFHRVSAVSIDPLSGYVNVSHSSCLSWGWKGLRTFGIGGSLPSSSFTVSNPQRNAWASYDTIFQGIENSNHQFHISSFPGEGIHLTVLKIGLEVGVGTSMQRKSEKQVGRRQEWGDKVGMEQIQGDPGQSRAKSMGNLAIFSWITKGILIRGQHLDSDPSAWNTVL